MAHADAPLRVEIERLKHEWLEGRTLPPMKVLVDIAPFVHVPERLQLVAECDGRVVGFLGAVRAVFAARDSQEDGKTGRFESVRTNGAQT